MADTDSAVANTTPKTDIDRNTDSVKVTLKSFKEIEYVTDVFGNNRLHQIFADQSPDIDYLRKVLAESKNLATEKNQFGRLPLHYALDRTNVNVGAMKMLLDAYPPAANVEDNDGVTPYDLCLKWGHPNGVQRLLLEAEPSQDWLQLMKLRWRFAAPAVIFFTDPFQRKRRALRVVSLPRGRSERVAIDDNNSKEFDETEQPNASPDIDNNSKEETV
jgi:ankyrin repeat protein